MSSFYNTRHYDVDWLRVLAFITLIFYHIGMFYVADWGWHVKSQYQSEPLQYFMLLVNQWRMPLIFFISGFALCMVESKFSIGRLLKIRFVRVHIPLIFGMYLIVPPQVFYEAVSNYAYAGSYWEFWLEYIDTSTLLLPEMHHGPFGLVTWNHLWYLMYLWVYTLLYVALKPALIRLGTLFSQSNVSPILIFVVPVVIMSIYGLCLKPLYPRSNALIGDWYNHALYFSVFMFGYFAAKSEQVWTAIIDHRLKWIAGGVLGYVGLMIIRTNGWFDLSNVLLNTLVQFWIYANSWFWLLAVIGFAGAYLNRPNKVLSYLNDAILPWYILHQTITIVLAMQLSRAQLGGVLESSILTIGTFVSCAVFYELIRRFQVTRFLFGMKLVSTVPKLAKNSKAVLSTRTIRKLDK